jgi:hypothetical protein
MHPETRFKNRIRPSLDRLPKSWWVKTAERSVKGIPDFLGCVAGYLAGLELKVPPNGLDALQRHTLKKIRASGGYAVELTPESWGQVYFDLKWLAAGHRIDTLPPESLHWRAIL